MSSFDVVGFGALNVDKLYRVNKIAGEDEESFIVGYNEMVGGSAANTVVALARLGLKTGFIGKVAKDREGNLLLKAFEEEGVDLKGILVVEKGGSGVVLGFVDEEGNRALYVAPGVNDVWELVEVDAGYARHTRFLHLTSFVGEKPLGVQMKLLEVIPKEVKVSFDPGNLYARKGLEALDSILKRTFLFTPSLEELRMLTGILNFRRGADTLIKKGVEIVAVKLGGQGCYITDGEHTHLVKAFEVDVVDTTGAGDAFSAGFLYGLVKGEDLYSCGKLGNFVASRCITKAGARIGLPKLSDLLAFKP